MTKKLQQALAELQMWIAQGREFPGVHAAMCIKFKLSDKDAKALINAYDNACDSAVQS